MDKPAYYDTVSAACDAIAEMAGGVIVNANIARAYAEQRNLPGTDYAARCTLAYLKAMVAAHDELMRCRTFKKLSEDIGPGQGA